MSQIIASTYELIEKLGAGGGGTVYLAQHLRLKKKVVLKADKRKLTVSQELLRREVDILKELSHSYIPTVYDFFAEGEDVYTVMDYIEGESLNKALKRGEKFTQAQVIRWACQLLDALCYLHAPIHGKPPKGFVHSDIKPANLMRTPQGDICLIDFNIALALGEEDVIGCSAGYASPEHYGLDFSTDDTQDSSHNKDENATLTLAMEDIVPEEEQLTVTISEQMSSSHSVSSSSSSTSRRKTIIPDVRSDIYSVGATLYHLLNGKRPSRNAKEVIPLSEEEFSPQVVRIISKAMNPNPDLRYQTADEMRTAFLNLRSNDPRMRKWKIHRRIASVLLPLFFIAGGLTAFAGLKRMQKMERWINLSEYSRKVLAGGDTETAIDTSFQILSASTEQFIPEYVPGVQETLTEALGVYDLTDGYKIYRTLKLPSPALYLAIAPNGKSGTVLYGHTVAVFDTANAEILAELPVEASAMSEIKYLNNNVILYAGAGGIKAYDIENACELWTGELATSISISADGKSVAGIYEGESHATVYDTENGEIKCRIDFYGKHQGMAMKDNLFALNNDGSLLGVSFEDGSLQIYDLGHPGNEFTIYNVDSGYRHFEGGFSGQYFAFSAANQEQSTFAIIDTVKREEVGGFQEKVDFGVQVDENGIYVQSGNVLIEMDPATGEQTPLADMSEDICCFDTNGTYTIATSEDEIFFFDKDTQLISRCKKEYKSDLVGIGSEAAVIGSMDQPVVRIMQYENNQDTEIFSYAPSYSHDETRISADGNTMMLFSYRQFRIYDKNGNIIKETELPEPDRVFDQQFVREGNVSYLEVIYDSGKTDVYSAEDGSLIREEVREIVKKDRDEEFLVDDLRVESPLHGTPIVYDVKTGKEVARLKADTYLTYITKADDYIVAQYITADGVCLGQLLDKQCEVLAELPYLRDVVGETLIFDYPTGSVRESKIYDINELMEMAQENRDGI